MESVQEILLDTPYSILKNNKETLVDFPRKRQVKQANSTYTPLFFNSLAVSIIRFDCPCVILYVCQLVTLTLLAFNWKVWPFIGKGIKYKTLLKFLAKSY